MNCLVFFLLCLLHVQLLWAYEQSIIGTSVLNMPIYLYRNASVSGLPRVLVLGNIHGNEQSGFHVVQHFVNNNIQFAGVDVFWIPTLNPDGMMLDTRENFMGVDLNRAFPDVCGRAKHSDGTPETRAFAAFVAQYHFVAVLSFHMGAAVIVWGPDQNCESSAFAVETPVAPFLKQQDTFWSLAYVHHLHALTMDKNYVDGIVEGSAMYQLSGSLLEFVFPNNTQLGIVIEMFDHKHPSNEDEIVVESDHIDALAAFIELVAKQSVAVQPGKSVCVDGYEIAHHDGWVLLPDVKMELSLC